MKEQKPWNVPCYFLKKKKFIHIESIMKEASH